MIIFDSQKSKEWPEVRDVSAEDSPHVTGLLPIFLCCALQGRSGEITMKKLHLPQ